MTYVWKFFYCNISAQVIPRDIIFFDIDNEKFMRICNVDGFQNCNDQVLDTPYSAYKQVN